MWLAHTNHRRDGAWTQRYERGIPVTDLVPVDDPGRRTGTTVHFMPDGALLGPTDALVTGLRDYTWPGPLLVNVVEVPDHSA